MLPRDARLARLGPLFDVRIRDGAECRPALRDHPSRSRADGRLTLLRRVRIVQTRCELLLERNGVIPSESLLIERAFALTLRLERLCPVRGKFPLEHLGLGMRPSLRGLRSLCYPWLRLQRLDLRRVAWSVGLPDWLRLHGVAL